MLQKVSSAYRGTKSGIKSSIRRSHLGGIPGITGVEVEVGSIECEEWGNWHYLVVDPQGIRPRVDSCYCKESKQVNSGRFIAGDVVEVERRRRAGWTRWLSLKHSEGWLFDISPKDRKVRMVEVEVQQDDQQYEVIADVSVLPRPQMGATPVVATLRPGQVIGVVERVRPLVGRGAFLKLGNGVGWVLDFVDGAQTLRKRRDDFDDVESVPLSPAKGNGGAIALSSEAEVGDWRYVVLDPKGITLRGRPTYNKAAKLKCRLEEGELVTIVERRGGAGTMYLRVDGPGMPSGWAFDSQPDARESFMRMMQVNLDEGSWYYRVVCEKGCALRSRCCISENAKVGHGPEKGAVVSVGQRTKVGSTTFLHMKDGSGWIFDRKDGKNIVEGPMEMGNMHDVGATVIAAEGLFLSKAPTNEPWAQTKMVVLPRAKVSVSLKVQVEGEAWLHVSQPGGMQGWVQADHVEINMDLSSSPGWARHPNCSN